MQTLEAKPSDCSTLAANLAKNAGQINADAHQCVGFTNGGCVAKFCSNTDTGTWIEAGYFATQVSLLSSCTNDGQNGVMAPCSDDSFEGSCAWWQIWLQSPSALETQGGGKASD